MNISKDMTPYVTTAFDLPGYSIVKNLGIVRGISVRTTGFSGRFIAAIQSLRAGDVPKLTELCEQTRKEALTLLIEQAQEWGANAIIGFRYDTNEVSTRATEVFAYGTAVIVEKK